MEIVAGEKDFDTSLRRALSEIDPDWPIYRGLIVVGSHTPEDIEHKLAKIQMAREIGKPFLGICLGHQLAAIEYARNVLGITDATSEEFGEEGTYVVKKRPDLKVGLHEGESWWSQYDVDPEVLAKWDKKPNFFSCAYHPEYGSTIDNPHPLLVQFLKVCSSV